MFVQDTQVFTDSGWKLIQDISGKDRVLVKNFAGDAEFIQPFALHKKEYDGEVIKRGAKDWSFTTTPDHKVAYTNGRLSRQFRYMFSESPKRETIKIKDEFGDRTVSFSEQDWYKLLGYVLTRGFIYQRNRPMLWLFLEPEKAEEEINILGDILDRYGIAYHVQYSDKTRPKLVVSSKNGLARRLITRLGSDKRKEMYLSDKIIYQSTKEQAKLLIETIIESSMKPATERGTVYQLTTTNKALIDSLTLLGTLNGYGMRTVKRENVDGMIKPKKDSYFLQISSQPALYSVKYEEKSLYSGYIYGIDLFDGLIYVKEDKYPIWTNPK